MKRASTNSFSRSTLILLASTVILIFCTSALLLQNYHLSQTNQQFLKEFVRGEKQRVSSAIEKLLPYTLKENQELRQGEPQVELAVSHTLVNDTLSTRDNQKPDLRNENRLDFSASPDQEPIQKVHKTPERLNSPRKAVPSRPKVAVSQSDQASQLPEARGEADHLAKIQADLLRGKILMEEGGNEVAIREEQVEEKKEEAKQPEEVKKEEMKNEVEEEKKEVKRKKRKRRKKMED